MVDGSDLFCKKDLLKMVKEGDKTTLHLHWEGEDEGDYVGEDSAKEVLEEIKAMAHIIGRTEEKTWEFAYVCTTEARLAEIEELREIEEER